MPMLQKVVRSTVIDAPIERVWAVLRDFNSHDQLARRRRREPHRGRRAQRPGRLRPQLHAEGRQPHPRAAADALRHASTSSTYCIVEATVPLQRYVATVTLKPVTDGNRTFWHWESTFATPPGRERELREMVAQGVYEAGFENLRRHLAQGGDLRAPATAGRCRPRCRCRTRRVRRAPLRRRRAAARPRTARRRRRAAGEVRIRQRAIGVNFIDVYLRRGWIPAMLPVSPRARRARHGGGRHGARRRRRRRRAAARRPRRLPRPGARRVLQRAHRAGRLGRAAAGGGRATRPPRRCCSRA